MPIIIKRLEFDAAHRLINHKGKCRNLHGHRYAAEFTVKGELDTVGRVVDFSVIKEEVGGWIDRELDHGFIANSADKELIALCKAQGLKLYVIDEPSTAERIAEHLYHGAQEILYRWYVSEKAEDPNAQPIVVQSVRLWETPTSSSVFPAL